MNHQVDTRRVRKKCPQIWRQVIFERALRGNESRLQVEWRHVEASRAPGPRRDFDQQVKLNPAAELAGQVECRLKKCWVNVEDDARESAIRWREPTSASRHQVWSP